MLLANTQTTIWSDCVSWMTSSITDRDRYGMWHDVFLRPGNSKHSAIDEMKPSAPTAPTIKDTEGEAGVFKSTPISSPTKKRKAENDDSSTQASKDTEGNRKNAPDKR
ncbi:hypothetical protein NXS19_001204 [Fusarium pseudograminearum]|nr:hypothetical protein NXS19_001204 [Fusarium pseudograminearum]